MLWRPTAWNTHYGKSYLEDCNVKIYDTDDNLLIDKDYIQKYSWRGEASFICERIPTDEATIVVIGWSKLSSTKKTYLSTKGNNIHISYVVGGDESGMKVMYIDDFKYDSTNLLATIKLKGLIQTMTEKAHCSLIESMASGSGSQITALFSYLGTKDFWLDYMPSNISKAQALQNLAIVLGGGLRYEVNDDEIQITPYPTAVLTYNKSNIFNRINFYKSEQSKDVVVLGAVANGGQYIEPVCIGKHTSSQYTYTFFDIEQDYFANFSQKLTNNGVSYSLGKNVYNDQLRYWQSSAGQQFYVLGQPLQLETTQEQGKTIISSFCFFDTGGHINYTPTQQKTIIKAYAERYYKMDTYAEFDCRIDPTLEPLDAIKTDGEYYWLESVSVEFNGGFRGHIKGRKQIETMPPLIKNLVNNGGSNFSFDIYNPNPFTTIVSVKHQGGQTAVIGSGGGLIPAIIFIAPFGTLTINQTNGASLSQDFQDDYTGVLAYDVYATLADGNLGGTYGTSDYEIILKGTNH